MTIENDIKQDEKIIVKVDSDLEELIPGFLEDWQKETKYMQEAVEKNDYDTIRKMGHNMKGTGGACGFNDITDMGSKLESAAKDMDPDVIRETLGTLSSYLEQVEVVYE
jgi:HPt (histidine-containing phosphotransfer) domain-containing protein